MAIDSQDLMNYRDSLQTLYNLLDQLYWSASVPGEAKGVIFDLSTAISPILTTLNQEGIAQDAAQLASLGATVAKLNAQMKTAQAQVNTLIKDVGIATHVAGLMDKAVELAAKVVGAP
jgi:hypothetical protein